MAFPRGTIWPHYTAQISIFRLQDTARRKREGETKRWGDLKHPNGITSNKPETESNTFTSLWPTQGQDDPSLGHVGQSYLATPWMLWHLQLWEIISYSSKENMCPPVETTVKLTSIWYVCVWQEHTYKARRNFLLWQKSISELEFLGYFPIPGESGLQGDSLGFFYMQQWVQPMFPLWLCATRYYSQLSTGGTEERRLFISSLS